MDRAKEVGRVTDGLRLKGSKEFARLNVEGASHVYSPSQRMEDLYQEHDPSYVARKTPANMALRTRLGYVGESNDSRLPDRNGIYWGNGVVNGPIDQLRVIEADIREKHPNWKFSYEYLPESQVSAMERAYDEAEEAEGWPIRSTDRNVVLGPVRERLEE